MLSLRVLLSLESTFKVTKTHGSGKDPCEFWDVIREDGVFVPGFTFDLYIAEHIAESKTKGDHVF